MQRAANGLIVVGVVLAVYGVLWQFGLAPGSRVELPAPMALQRSAAQRTAIALESAEAAPTVAPTPAPAATVAPVATPRPQPTAVGPAAPAAAAAPIATLSPSAPAPVAPLPPAPDAADRHLAAQRPPPGYAVRLAIPAIKLETEVQQGGVVPDADGNPTWETLPFVAVHYGDLTARIGAQGNAVIAGHVVTLREGNVFRFLYQLDLEDQVKVWDQRDHEHDYRVVDVKLVPPSDTSVMAPTPDETLTLITCGGTFDPVKREFSDRLIVTAKPV